MRVSPHAQVASRNSPIAQLSAMSWRCSHGKRTADIQRATRVQERCRQPELRRLDSLAEDRVWPGLQAPLGVGAGFPYRVEARAGESRAKVENSVAHAAPAFPETKRPDLSAPHSWLARAFAQKQPPDGVNATRLRTALRVRLDPSVREWLGTSAFVLGPLWAGLSQRRRRATLRRAGASRRRASGRCLARAGAASGFHA